jgi:hypothetical protein
MSFIDLTEDDIDDTIVNPRAPQPNRALRIIEETRRKREQNEFYESKVEENDIAQAIYNLDHGTIDKTSKKGYRNGLRQQTKVKKLKELLSDKQDLNKVSDRDLRAARRNGDTGIIDNR